MNLPDLEKAMKPILDDGEAKKKQIEVIFVKNRENILRKIPAGERLDRAMAKLEADRTNQIKIVDDEENVKLDPYLKQKQIHDELLKQQ